MIYQEGQKVKIEVRGQKYEGTILHSTEFGSGYWWIQYEINGYNNCSLFDEQHLDEWNRKIDCTCGADATYFPKQPPGHAFHCEVLK